MAQLCLELFVPELGNTVIVNPHLALLPSASVAVYKILCFPALKGEYPSYTFYASSLIYKTATAAKARQQTGVHCHIYESSYRVYHTNCQYFSPKIELTANSAYLFKIISKLLIKNKITNFILKIVNKQLKSADIFS